MTLPVTDAIASWHNKNAKKYNQAEEKKTLFCVKYVWKKKY